jgi:hypothetical protein
MLRFKEYLSEMQLTHSQHLEDLVFLEKATGAKKALKALKDIAESIGTAKARGMLTTKIDGAPAVIFGSSPEYYGGRFFVGTKSIFNKDPKVNFTQADVARNHAGGLQPVLSAALKYLADITPKGRIFQGDMLFTNSTLKSETIDGEDCWAWHPNTILYSVAKNSKIGARVGKAKIGIAVHTEYTARDDTLSVKGFGVKESLFKKSSDVFLMDVYHKSIGTMGKFTGSEADRFWNDWNTAVSSVSKIDWKLFDSWFVTDLMVFVNTYIRAGKQFPDAKRMVDDFCDYYVIQAEKHAAKVKTQKAKDRAFSNAFEIQERIRAMRPTLSSVFVLFKSISEMKLAIIRKIEEVKGIGTFVLKSDGTFETTGQEGYVIASGPNKSVKLVSRAVFARNNFSAEIVKGFER